MVEGPAAGAAGSDDYAMAQTGAAAEGVKPATGYRLQATGRKMAEERERRTFNIELRTLKEEKMDSCFRGNDEKNDAIRRGESCIRPFLLLAAKTFPRET
jgi:uncharacterized membrane protein